MRVATQRTDEVAVGGHGADATVVFVEYGGTDDDAVPDGVGEIELVFWTVDYGVDVGLGILAFI